MKYLELMEEHRPNKRLERLTWKETSQIMLFLQYYDGEEIKVYKMAGLLVGKRREILWQPIWKTEVWLEGTVRRILKEQKCTIGILLLKTETSNERLWIIQ